MPVPAARVTLFVPEPMETSETITPWISAAIAAEIIPSRTSRRTRSAGRSIGWSVNPGTWDIKLTDCDGNVLATQMGVEVGGSPVAFQYN